MIFFVVQSSPSIARRQVWCRGCVVEVVAELSSIVAWHGQQTIDGEKPSIRTTKEKEFVERIKSDSVFENEKSFSGSILFDFVFPTGNDFLCSTILAEHREASVKVSRRHRGLGLLGDKTKTKESWLDFVSNPPTDSFFDS
jgi:hypothetical protein